MNAAEVNSEWFSYAGPHESMYQVVSLVITKHDTDSPDRYRCRYTSNETGLAGKFDWISGCYLFATRDEAWKAAAKHMEEQAARCMALAEKYHRKAACERGETTDCPDAHLCRHGIDN
jgi:hypothetical protein